MIFGLMGYGRFGQLWAKALSSFGKVIIYDKISHSLSPDNANIVVGTLREVAEADIIFLLTPISQFENACLSIKKYIKNDALLLDCCSVKMYPVQIMQKIFTHHPIIATHPLFGPDSVRKNGGLTGHKIVVCSINCKDELDRILTIFKKMGLQVLITTPEEHDKQMANSQGLVHFLGRGLASLAIQEQALATPDFKALLHINHMVMNDTWQLFLDMHRYNPFTKKIRIKLIEALIKLNNEVDYESND